MEQRKQAKGRPAADLSALAPELAAALVSQVARVDAALAAGVDPDILQNLVTPDPDNPAWDVHLMAALGALTHPAIPRLLAALFGEARDKVRRKALKKTLHLLKTRGVAVAADLLPREAASLGAPRPGTIKALVSPIFGNGDSYVILEGPPGILGGNFLVSRVSDLGGLSECVLLSLNRQQQTEFWEQFREQGLDQWLAPPPAYAVRLLEEAYQRQPDNDAGYRYAAWREKIFRHWGPPEAAPDLDQVLPPVPPGERSRLLEHSRKLAVDPLFHSWIPGEAAIAPWLEKLAEVENSPLVLTDQQKQVRIDALLDEATRALYPVERRGDWRRRLRAMAYYLHLAGRQEDSRAALAAAADLDEPDRSALTGETPLLKALVQVSGQLLWEMQQPRETPAASGLVAPPGEARLIRR
jgi:hypothetical protein